ncbi:olfactory receptor 5V1-like [Microcaecilia unicolor]|uniref:Olfactory receptor 5V1-like n=1 Tax=Microcaecilia unicolor TaxID=1415580 RepID=A0A6P7WXE4_9AMPH|nr:olfactory receptor 5V1-like [Microcaecilia unicolor]
MGRHNGTTVTEFTLLGLSDLPKLQPFLFVLFLCIYLITLAGNALIISVIKADRQLHTPMYYFLGNFSLVDICLSSVTVPRLLAQIISGRKSISFVSCIAQLHFFILVATMEDLLLGVMAFDRYMAICNPLRYPVVMSKRLCALLVASCWIISSLHALIYSIMASRLPFCGSTIIHHFFCDIPPLLKLSCADTTTYELVIFTEGSLVVMSPCILIIVSYIYIISAILKVSSKEGRSKAFSTCFSHLMVVILFFGTDMFTYFRPSSSYSLNYDRVVSVMYTIVTPMLNSFIYSLRNSDVKRAIQRAISRTLQ